jgi:hypothetical protein
MSISSVTASPPVKPPEAREPKAPTVKTDNDAGVSRTPRPTVLAALPPGQGTRIDQLA